MCSLQQIYVCDVGDIMDNLQLILCSSSLFMLIEEQPNEASHLVEVQFQAHDVEVPATSTKTRFLFFFLGGGGGGERGGIHITSPFAA